MRRVIPLVLAILLIAAPCLAARAIKISFIHDIAVDDAKTNAVPIPDSAKYVGVLIPNLDAGAVGVEIFESGATSHLDVPAASLLASSDTNWYPILDLTDGADAEICASGNDPGYIDITPFLGALRNVWIRFTVGTQTAGNTTWYLYYKE